jgi:hypothetical protein
VPEIAQIFKTDVSKYNATAKEWTRKYAMWDSSMLELMGDAARDDIIVNIVDYWCEKIIVCYCDLTVDIVT